MEPHPIDPTALVIGLLFSIGGLAIIADQQWHDVDVTAFAAAGVTLTGLLLAALILARNLRRAPDAGPGTQSADTAGGDEADA